MIDENTCYVLYIGKVSAELAVAEHISSCCCVVNGMRIGLLFEVGVNSLGHQQF